MTILEIIIKELQPGENESIVVTCRSLSPELLRVLNTLKSHDVMLIASAEGRTHRIDPSSVFYIESVDNKTFLYCESDVYESKQRLYELEEILAAHSFLRISKSIIVNCKKIESFAPALSGRLEASLLNGERVIISRNYVNDLKNNLGI